MSRRRHIAIPGFDNSVTVYPPHASGAIVDGPSVALGHCGNDSACPGFGKGIISSNERGLDTFSSRTRQQPTAGIGRRRRVRGDGREERRGIIASRLRGRSEAGADDEHDDGC